MSKQERLEATKQFYNDKVMLQSFEPLLLASASFDISPGVIKISSRTLIDYEAKIPQSKLYATVAKVLIDNPYFSAYEKAVKEKGNTLKRYTPKLNQKAIGAYLGQVQDNWTDRTLGKLYIYDALPALVEYDKKGELKSILLNGLNSHVMFNQVDDVSYAPTSTHINILLLNEAEINQIKFRLSKNFFKENELD